MAAQPKVELFSGRVKKIKPANVSEQRYDFLKLSEAEPDLGVPQTTDSADVRRILLTDKNGKRYWSESLQVDDNGNFQNDGGIQAQTFSTDRLEVTDSGLNARFADEDINLTTVGDLKTTGLVKFNSAMGVKIGQPDQGELVSRAVAMNTATPVSRGMAQMNFILGKLVPKPPPNFPKLKNGNVQPFTILDVSSYRMCDFTQSDRTGDASKNVAGGTVVNEVLRTSSYQTSIINDCGPGDRGTVTIYKNGVAAGSKTLTPALQESENDLSPVYLLGTDNGTVGDLVITDDKDYALVAVPSISPLFWQVFDSRGQGTVQEGWNKVQIKHNNLFPETVPATVGETSVAYWYYDASTPGNPEFSETFTFDPSGTDQVTYSSGIPHYTSAQVFTLGFTISNLSGDMYPTNDTFITSQGGGAFGKPIELTYAAAGITTPLPRNYLTSPDSISLSTTVNVKDGAGLSNSPVSLIANNSYSTSTKNFTPSGLVLYKKVTGNIGIEETNIPVSTDFGSGTDPGSRIILSSSQDTPVIPATTQLYNNELLNANNYVYEAVVMASSIGQMVLKHDKTNYFTGYLPQGPDYSIGRDGAQYFTFRFIRSSTSRFRINITGKIRGMFVAVPGLITTTDTTKNNWLDMSKPYAGSGSPGTNGSNGCSDGGVITLGDNISQSPVCTLGTSNTANSTRAQKEIYIRIKLLDGDVVTALSISKG